jgi:UDP-N-acetylglucosamine:LPS N-acetylglucosamine transferase
MSRARFIICRSGYTTVMEIAETEIPSGFFIPTPGQTEQVYLSEYYMKQGWFLSRNQDALDILSAVSEAARFHGFPPVNKTAEYVERLYRSVPMEHL